MFIRVARQGGVVGLNVQLEVVVQSIVFQESYDTHGILVKRTNIECFRPCLFLNACELLSVNVSSCFCIWSSRTVVILVLARLFGLRLNQELTLKSNLFFVPWEQYHRGTGQVHCPNAWMTILRNLRRIWSDYSQYLLTAILKKLAMCFSSAATSVLRRE